MYVFTGERLVRGAGAARSTSSSRAWPGPTSSARTGAYLVNLKYVDEVVPMFNRTYELVMKDDRRSRVPVSRRKAVELRDLLGF